VAPSDEKIRVRIHRRSRANLSDSADKVKPSAEEYSSINGKPEANPPDHCEIP
jgi:hypothetical protein